MDLKTSAVTRLLAVIDPRRSWVSYLVAAGMMLAVGIVLLGPSITSHLNIGERVVFWFAHVGAAVVLLEGAQLLIGRSPIARHLPPFVLVIMAGVIGALVFSAFSILFLEGLLSMADPSSAAEQVSVPAFLAELRNSAGQVVLFWVLLNGPRLIMIAQDDDQDTAGADFSPPVQADGNALDDDNLERNSALVELVSRLPRRVGTDIVALTAELHYLRVYTRQGDALILMSFGRAVEALRVIPGMAVHRSHWIALNHVVTLETDGERVLCLLDTGLTIPVSRKNRAALRQALTKKAEHLALRAATALASAEPERG
jgi:hypothetical protein